MIRISVLLLLFVAGRAQAHYANTAFDTDQLAAVYTEALTFIAPRILVPFPVSQLTAWGLQGLTALDPDIAAGLKDGHLLLSRRGHVLIDIVAPDDEMPATWADTAVRATAALSPLSTPIRSAGRLGITQAFFDEMFSHIDPYSRYVAPVEAEEERARRGGRAGIGVTVEQRGRWITVRSVARDGPAAIAGLKPGDVLLTIDGQRTQDQDPTTIAALLAGPEGSIVSLTWRTAQAWRTPQQGRTREWRTRDAQMVRAMVAPETVFVQHSNDLLVLRITGFSTSTAAHIALSVQDALAQPRPLAGIVLDLRDNRGGLLHQAVTAADAFLPAGVVATTTGRDPDANHVWRSADGELAENLPLIILVDGHTASSAEVLAAALADRGRAVVVGSSTVGKGVVQTIDPLPDGGELFVSWSRILAPLGWPLQGLGVLPQVCTSLGWEPLNRQLAALSTGFQPMAREIAAERAARAPVSAIDVIALRAPCPAAEGRAADVDAARSLIANPAAYAAALLPPMMDR